MPQRCTCGAELPANALFCHQCGRPQRDVLPPIEALETPPGEEHPPPSAAPVLPPQPPRVISFSNPDVIRSAYPPAAVAAILGSIQFVSMLCFLWYPAAGFASVYLYRIRTGIFLAPRAGAKIGAITGLLVFAISLLIATVGYLLGGGADVGQAVREALEQSGQPEELQRNVLNLINNPATLALVLLFGLALQLIVTAGFAILGGALGAKVLEREE
ncbi:MAG: zinc ribbon domain-containing protein [Bryobacterales bacterium]